MIRKRRKQLVQLFVLSDFLAIVASFVLTFVLRFYSRLFGVTKGIPSFKEYLKVIPFLLLIQLLYFSYQGFYKIKLRRNRLDDLFLILLNSTVSVVIVLLIFSYLKSYRIVTFEISHVFLIVYVPLTSLILFVFRQAIFRMFRNTYLGKNGSSRILIAGDGDLAEITASNLTKYSHFGIEVAGFLSTENRANVLGGYDELEQTVKTHSITDLFIALPLKEYDRIMRLIEIGNNLLIDIYLVPDILQLASLKAGMEHVEGLPIINLGDIPLQGWRAGFKRIFDFAVSLVGLIVMFPFLLLIALLIKLDSRGPVLYHQIRVGLDGRNFRVFKFRSMVHQAEMQTGPIWSPPQDKRITRFGRFLRKYSIDELPQFVNILLGEMSLVGPRPERPEFVEKFKHLIPRYMLRHRVKSGITGWAQVHGLRGNTPLDKRIEFDIYYIQNWTFRIDLEILWRTIIKFKFIDRND